MVIEAISPKLKQYRKSKSKVFYKKGDKKAFTIERKDVGVYAIELNPKLIANLPIQIVVHK